MSRRKNSFSLSSRTAGHLLAKRNDVPLSSIVAPLSLFLRLSMVMSKSKSTSISMSFSMSMSLSISVYLYVYLYLCLCVCLCLFMSISPAMHISMSLSMCVSMSVYVYVYVYVYFNAQNFEGDQQKLPWDSLDKHQKPNDTWNAWKKLFLSVADVHLPVTKKRERNKPTPWITPLVRKHMFLRNSLKKEAIRTQNRESWTTYKRIRNLTKLIAEAKAEFYQTRLESIARNPKEICKTINDLINRKDSNSTINEITFDNKKLNKWPLRTLNEHFANVGTKFASKLPEDSKHFEEYIKPARTTFDLKPRVQNQPMKNRYFQF